MRYRISVSMLKILPLLAAFFLVGPSHAQTRAVTMTSLLEHMLETRNAPFRNYTQHFAASTDPRGELRSNEKILADIQGPGALTRFWSTRPHVGRIRVYFDNERAPTINSTSVDFFDGKHLDVKSALSRMGSGSLISNLGIPMPFRERALVTIEGSEPVLYFQVNHIKFQPGTEVETFSPVRSAAEEAALKAVVNRWSNSSLPSQARSRALRFMDDAEQLAHDVISPEPVSGAELLAPLQLPSRSAPPPRTDFEFGVNIHLAADPQVHAMADMGAQWVRIDMNWSIMEKEQGVWDFQPFDDTISNAKARGMKVLAVLAYSPPWATSDGKESSVPRAADWRRFVDVAVARYGKAVDAFALWNEPNLAQFWTGSVEQYTDVIMKPGCEAIREGAPRVPIVAPELAHLYAGDIPQPIFYATIALKGLSDCVDILGHHIYAGTVDDLRAKVLGYRTPRGTLYRWGLLQWMQIAGWKNKQVWITEYGYNVRGVNGSTEGFAQREAEQARQLVEQTRYMYSIDWIRKVFLFEMTDGPDPVEAPYQYGILRNGGEPRPGYYELQKLIENNYRTIAVPRPR